MTRSHPPITAGYGEAVDQKSPLPTVGEAVDLPSPLDSHVAALRDDAASMGREGAHFAVIADQIEALAAAPDVEGELQIGDKVKHVHMGVRGIIRSHIEGWWGVEWSDGSVAVCRPSHLTALTKERPNG